MTKPDSGSYQIYISLSKRTKICIGALGEYYFQKGLYIYTGSAMKNLQARVNRHLRKEKKIRWHIDYLLASRFAAIIKIDVFPSETRQECSRNMELIYNGASIPINHFGSSDCKTCHAHLVFLQK
jgi:Uri superfamily endonuclease